MYHLNLTNGNTNYLSFVSTISRLLPFRSTFVNLTLENLKQGSSSALQKIAYEANAVEAI